MAEQHNRPHPPTLDDYQAMMSDLRAPEQLREAVLKEAREMCIRDRAWPNPRCPA